LGMVLVEACVDCVESIVNAHLGGARRIELCAGLIDGGVTPSAGMIATACDAANKLDPPIPVNVLIRPRGGDFVFTEVEVAAMLADIAAAGAHGASGVVIGALTPEGTIDVVTSARLIKAARSVKLKVTYHRAVDMTTDIMTAFQTVLDLNVDIVLTSGGCNTATEGASTIQTMVGIAATHAATVGGKTTIVLPGAGINEKNAAALVAATGVTEVHGSFRSPHPCATTYKRQGVFMGGSKENTQESEFIVKSADAAKIAAAIASIKEIE